MNHFLSPSLPPVFIPTWRRSTCCEFPKGRPESFTPFLPFSSFTSRLHQAFLSAPLPISQSALARGSRELLYNRNGRASLHHSLSLLPSLQSLFLRISEKVNEVLRKAPLFFFPLDVAFSPESGTVKWSVLLGFPFPPSPPCSGDKIWTGSSELPLLLLHIRHAQGR